MLAEYISLELGREYHFSYIRDICTGARPNSRDIRTIARRYLDAGLLESVAREGEGMASIPSSSPVLPGNQSSKTEIAA